MTTQLTMLQDPIDREFLEFHHNQPEVYRRLVQLAREWRDAGNDRCSINMLFEIVRYDRGLRTNQADFKLNNNFRSRYARLIAANEADLADAFQTRALASERGEI